MYIDAQGKRWFKGNLHLHTTVSDGRLDPEDAYRLYKSHGYDFIARTDHWRWGETSSFEGMTVLSGCEYNIDGDVRQGVYHMLAVGMERDPEIDRETATPQGVIDAVHAAGGVCGLAHPAWSLNTPEMIMGLKHADFTEIYNSVSALPRNCRPYSGNVLDITAMQGCILPLSATDDVHFYVEGYDACRSFIYLQSDSAEPKDLVSALKAGRFYATQGPILACRLEGDRLILDTSPAQSVVWFNDRPWMDERSLTGPLTHAEYTFHPRDTFVRAEVTDAEGNTAWTPYFRKP